MNLARKIHLREGESIIASAQRFWITLIWWYVLGLLFWFASFFFMFRLFTFGWWGYALFGLGIFIGLFIIFRTWFFSSHNIFIITGERVVDISRQGWFDEIVSSVSLNDIHDATIRKKGMCASMFNYGNLSVETRSRQFVVEAEKIKNPQKMQVMILEAEEKYRQSRRLSNIQAVYHSFIKIIPDIADNDLLSVHELIRIRLEEKDGGLNGEVV
jgi:hypothetical protein